MTAERLYNMGGDDGYDEGYEVGYEYGYAASNTTACIVKPI